MVSGPAGAGAQDLPPLVLIGGGGHALVVAEAALLAGWAVAGFCDDAGDAVLGRGVLLGRAVPRLGGLDGPPRLPEGVTRFAYVVAVGGLELRRRVIGSLGGGTGEIGRVVHPRAVVSPSAEVGAGAFVGPGAVVHTRAEVGPHAIVNSGAVVEHECVIGENAHIAPGAVLGGCVRVGPDTLVGLGARVLPGVRIGSGCRVGAGAVVTRHVPDGATVVGVPARE